MKKNSTKIIAILLYVYDCLHLISLFSPRSISNFNFFQRFINKMRVFNIFLLSNLVCERIFNKMSNQWKIIQRKCFFFIQNLKRSI